MKKKMLLFIGIFSVFSLLLTSNAYAETYENYSSNVVSCGGNYVTKIPAALPKVISTIYIIIQIVVPILLVIFGMIDLFKGITAQKEEELKKAQQLFIKRLISGALVFFVFVAVKLLISLVADNSGKNGVNRIMDCAECFIENNSKCVKSKI